MAFSKLPSVPTRSSTKVSPSSSTSASAFRFEEPMDTLTTRFIPFAYLSSKDFIRSATFSGVKPYSR